MSVQVDVHVTDVVVVMTTFTKILIERSATETGFLPAGGSQIASVPLVPGTDDYSYLDPVGTDTDWYRSRYSDASGVYLSGYSMVVEGEALPSLVSVSDVRALVTTTLTDEQLSDVIAREEAELASIIGPLSGERTEPFLLTRDMSSNRITLRRPTNAVAVTDNGNAVDAADIRLLADQRTILRFLTSIPTGAYSYGYWLGPVEATYSPNDTERVRRVLIDLVAVGLSEASGAAAGEIVSETIGSYSYTRGRTASAALTTEQRRRALVASLLPRQLPGSIRIRSSIIGRRGLLGTVRPA